MLRHRDPRGRPSCLRTGPLGSPRCPGRANCEFIAAHHYSSTQRHSPPTWYWAAFLRYMYAPSPLLPSSQDVPPRVTPGPSRFPGARRSPATKAFKAEAVAKVKVGRKTTQRALWPISGGTWPPPASTWAIPPSRPAPPSGPPSWYRKSKNSVIGVTPQFVEGTRTRGGHREPTPWPCGGQRDSTAPSPRSPDASPRGGHRQASVPASRESGAFSRG